MGKIKDIPICKRPREKAIKNGISSLSDSELLALIIKTGNKTRSAVELAQDVINTFGGLENLNEISIEQLTKINGIKNAKAVEIISVFEISKRSYQNKVLEIEKISDPSQIASYFIPFLKDEKQELFLVAYLDVKNNLIKYETLFKGGISSAVVDIKIVLKNSLKYGASKIICIHNHPSGDPSPSLQDVDISKKIKVSCEAILIDFLDHIIIGNNKYISLKTMGLF